MDSDLASMASSLSGADLWSLINAIAFAFCAAACASFRAFSAPTLVLFASGFTQRVELPSVLADSLRPLLPLSLAALLTESLLLRLPHWQAAQQAAWAQGLKAARVYARPVCAAVAITLTLWEVNPLLAVIVLLLGALFAAALGRLIDLWQWVAERGTAKVTAHRFLLLEDFMALMLGAAALLLPLVAMILAVLLFYKLLVLLAAMRRAARRLTQKGEESSRESIP